MAILAPGLLGIAFDQYYKGRLGLTLDLRKIQMYHDALKGHPTISRYTVKNLAKILKFDWSPHLQSSIAVKVSREPQPRLAKIVGFLNYGKVFLQDVNDPPFHIIANPDEIIKAIRSIAK